MLEHEGVFADALGRLLGVNCDDEEGEAAIRIVAETLLMHRNWLKSKHKSREKQTEITR